MRTAFSGAPSRRTLLMIGPVLFGLALIAFVQPGRAHALSAYDNVQGSPTPGDAPARATGPLGRIGGDVPLKVAPVRTAPASPGPGGAVTPAPPARAKLNGVRCFVRSKTRICMTFRAGVAVKRCAVNGRGKKRVQVCSTLRRDGSVKTRCTRRGTRAPICVKPKIRRSRALEAGPRPAMPNQTPIGRAFLDGLLNSGFSNPTNTAVVRIYKADASTATKGHCTGALLRRGVVLTAAHCLYANATDGGGTGYYNTSLFTVTPGNFVDTAGQNRTTIGNYSVAATVVADGWIANDGGQDWGLMLLNPDARGAYPGDVTGTFTATWNAGIGPGERLYKYGYPSDRAFDTAYWYYGAGQYFCDMIWDGETHNTWPYTWSSFNIVTSPCLMNGGSSGGPVLAYFPAEGQWSIIGVNNRGWPRADGQYGEKGISSYMDTRFGNFWNKAIAAWGG